MLIDLFLMFVTVLLAIVYTILATISTAIGFVFPEEIGAAWNTAFSYMGLLQGIFPIDTAVAAVSFLITVIGIMYFVKLVLFFLNKIRGVSQPGSSDMPNM